MNAGLRRSGLLVPGALALVGLLILLGLGSWQIERKAWKEALIATLARRAAAPPVDLPPASAWSTLTPDNAEFMRVRLRAEFRGAAPAYVYTSGSSLRDDVKGTGYFVFEPARLSDGRQVVINRGFVPTWTFPQVRAPQDIVGAIRFPEQPSWLFPAHSGVGETWTVRDTEGMAALRGWGAVAPFYIEQEAPVPPGGLPHPAPLKARLRNDHLQYAITWYALAAVLAVMFAIWAVKRRREQRG